MKSFDPFVPFENISAAVFFGGLIDALKKAQQKQTAKSKDSNAESNKLQTDLDAKKSN
jgi:hypothetical protein